jgi:hypothetical protein
LLFIEGIGSNFGLFYQNMSIEDLQFSNVLLCSSKEQELVYVNPLSNGECNIEWVNILNYKTEEIKIAPNPVDQNLVVTSDNPFEYPINLKIYDSSGLLIKTILDYRFETPIDLQFLSRGFYVIHIDSEYTSLGKSFIKL